MTISKEISDAYGKLSTSTVSDALDKLGVSGGCLGISPVVNSLKMVGTAYTVHYVPTGYVKGTVGDYIDDVQPGQVIVLDNNGRMDCTVWGDILTMTSSLKGISGTVIDGVCRDVDGIRAYEYPVFSRGKFMMTGKDRVMVDAVGWTVSIGNVQVRQDDLLMGDDSGVIVVPSAMIESVLETATDIDQAEQGIMEAVKSGLSISEARKKFAYHSLQTKAQ